ncbi:MAG: glutathione S-transferase N-terminal domain-containing protein [Pseudomonadota bacterium]
MPMNEPVRLVGATASPYTQKMVALLRYRRIPYAITWGQPETVCEELGISRPRPALMPTFFLSSDGETRAVCDSTPIIRTLEESHEERSVLPPDPALAFIDYLLEDFADEWCTKYMFHYRWYAAADADNAGTILPLALSVTTPSEQHSKFKAFFSERQINRLYVVGSNDITAPVIDASYRRFLGAMEELLSIQPFLLGMRPSAGDFGLYGQLTQLVGFDPTPRAIAHELSPRTVAWVGIMADGSGQEPAEADWVALEQQPDALKGLLREIGRVYAPAQLANARAFAAGEKNWDCEIDGAPWTQPTFPYQAKTLRWTRDRYEALSEENRHRVDACLAGTGVEAMLVGE